MSFDFVFETSKNNFIKGLNPFRAGRCLSTSFIIIIMEIYYVSIPFEQGDVFRQIMTTQLFNKTESQSLSSRAMSFDRLLKKMILKVICLNPFRAGRCLSTFSSIYHFSSRYCLNPFRAGRCLSTKS